MDDAAWHRLEQLWPQDTHAHGFPADYEAYAKWIVGLVARAPRRKAATSASVKPTREKQP
jgi:hypothetical protein